MTDAAEFKVSPGEVEDRLCEHPPSLEAAVAAWPTRIAVRLSTAKTASGKIVRRELRTA